MTHALAARRHSPFYLYLATGAVKRQSGKREGLRARQKVNDKGAATKFSVPSGTRSL